MTLTLFRVAATIARDPGEALARINRELARDNDSMMFVTVFAGVLDLATGELVHANAGHPPPYLLRPDGIEALTTTVAPALGVIDDAEYPLGRFTLAPFEGLLLFTDGVTEAQNPAGDLWGTEPLEAFLRDQRSEPCEVIVKQLVAAVGAFEAGALPADDLTLMALRRGPG
jgi:sigma-B regulation protein RsbU (phosphoserine phosphatase)